MLNSISSAEIQQSHWNNRKWLVHLDGILTLARRLSSAVPRPYRQNVRALANVEIGSQLRAAKTGLRDDTRYQLPAEIRRQSSCTACMTYCRSAALS